MQPSLGTSYQSLEKALKILLSFCPYNQEAGTLELSEKSGLHKSTVNRLLHVLEFYGFVRQNPQTKKFILGPSVIELGGAVNHSLRSHLVTTASPYLDRLRNTFGETVLLEVMTSRTTIVGYVAEGAGPIHLKENVGHRHYYHASAGGKAILASSSPDFREGLLREKMVRRTRNTVTDPKLLQQELERTRRRGFAFDDEETHTGVKAYGCPIFNYDKTPVAAVVVAGSSQKITWDKRSRFVPELKNTAEQISKRLLYEGDS